MVVTEEKQVSSNLGLKSLSSLHQRRGRHGKIEDRGGSCPVSPIERRPSSPATAQAPLLHFCPVVPVRPLQLQPEAGGRPHIITPSLTRTRTSNASFRQPFPGEGWASGISTATTPPLGCLSSRLVPGNRSAGARRPLGARARAFPAVHEKVGPGRAAGQSETRARASHSV